jgi:hypothetical protein
VRSNVAARRFKPHHQDDIRAKIQSAQLVKALTDHVTGRNGISLDATQVAAALGLLRKTVPDLTSTELIHVEELPSELELLATIQRLISANPALVLALDQAKLPLIGASSTAEPEVTSE